MLVYQSVSTSKSTFEDVFPFRKVGYLSSLEGTYLPPQKVDLLQTVILQNKTHDIYTYQHLHGGSQKVLVYNYVQYIYIYVCVSKTVIYCMAQHIEEPK